jgi:hypothetical protein
MSRYIERTMDGKTRVDVDLTESNAQWPHPWHLVRRASLHQELKRVAISEERSGTPVKLFPHHRVVKVDPQQGVTLDNGNVVEADVILGADGIFVGHGCHSDFFLAVADMLTLLGSRKQDGLSSKPLHSPLERQHSGL